MTEKTNKKKTEEKNSPQKEKGKISCSDAKCHLHGNIKVRGRIFEGRVTKKFPTRIAIEFERMIYNKKYERYSENE